MYIHKPINCTFENLEITAKNIGFIIIWGFEKVYHLLKNSDVSLNNHQCTSV